MSSKLTMTHELIRYRDLNLEIVSEQTSWDSAFLE